jgi:hypothetical protein
MAPALFFSRTNQQHLSSIPFWWHQFLLHIISLSIAWIHAQINSHTSSSYISHTAAISPHLPSFSHAGTTGAAPHLLPFLPHGCSTNSLSFPSIKTERKTCLQFHFAAAVIILKIEQAVYEDHHRWSHLR